MSTDPKIQILLTGATGYVGGSVLAKLLEHEKKSAFAITAIVRSADKAKLFAEVEERTGVPITPVQGSHSDAALVASLASQSDVVIAAADVDDLEAARAILGGLRQRYEKTGVKPILLHTSGTAVFCDHAAGLSGDAPVYDDTDLAQLAKVPDSAPHRNVELTVFEADAQGYVETYIISPSTIYGRATGILVDLGIQNPKSQQIPRLARLSVKRGRAGMVGKGLNYWPNVHIDEVADLFMVIFDEARKTKDARNPALGHGREGYYVAANGEHKLYQISQAIGKALVKLGKSDNAEPTTFTDDEVEELGGDVMANVILGGNSRTVARRGKLVGWTPAKTTSDMLASVEEEVKFALEN
ncbi:NAD(P)-binding protein [Punctularia strigosozonata HHB-11173 SS5]|uniref:NAD(P)-binding protein n=1 Tax=Punctularia strigosozonata (strain HHB-11173) TaxID=741275 RepID=R7S5P4_PUNST|nr:NAD(P)-binding protein [Punctularia strigosozonata HHB-11173 SS5]EIN04821.1 NAD(P)-binding protein [Punctularia strigosozonata HHB-11173 SS5]